MITLTPQAAKQIGIAADQGQMGGLPLRLAARKNPDGSLDYGLGFDEANEDDMTFVSEGVDILVAPEHGPLLKGAVLDYVELNPGEFHFIFLNPNDPNFRPPQGEGGCGSGGCNSGGCSSC